MLSLLLCAAKNPLLRNLFSWSCILSKKNGEENNFGALLAGHLVVMPLDKWPPDGL